MEYSIKSAPIRTVIGETKIEANISGGSISTTIGEGARMNVSQATVNVESGKAEIEKAVQQGKQELDTEGQKYVDLAKDWAIKTDGTVDGSEYSSKYWAEQILPLSSDISAVADDIASVVAVAGDLTNIDNASTYAAEAKQWAIGDPTEPTGNSAKHWAEEASSTLSGLTARVEDIEEVIPSDASDTNQLADKSYVDTADNGLQSQIDALVVASDVFDVVGTYAELQAYDISTVPVNDIIKVLVDSTHSEAATYYRCVETGGVKSWSYIGSEGAYYTKSEADNKFVPQTRTVNSKALSSDIALTASDVGALESGDNVSELVNDAGYTTNIGTVTSVNGNLPDSSGAVTISGLTIDQTYDGTSANAQSGIAIAGLLNAMYPVGSLYIGTQATCPMSTVMSGTTWTLVSAGHALWTGNGQSGSGTTTNANYANAKANTTIAAGLPNITGRVTPRPLSSASGAGTITSASGAFSLSQKTGGATSSMAITSTNYGSDVLTFDASSSSSIYGNSTTVQPPAYVVNVWRRTA